jgi:hypothetical protein
MQLKFFPVKATVLFLLAIFFSGSTQAKAQSHLIKFNEFVSCFNGAAYPACLFGMLEQRGYIRIDKQYPEYCERPIYYWAKGGKPGVFVNPMHCSRPIRSPWYPVKGKEEIELQFQKSSRAYFESLSAQIRKSCKALPSENSIVSSSKTNAKIKAYRHEASGTTFLIRGTSPVAYIYLVK